jgi:hypothetical protein
MKTGSDNLESSKFIETEFETAPAEPITRAFCEEAPRKCQVAIYLYQGVIFPFVRWHPCR